MAITILRFTNRNATGTKIIADICVSTVSELPTPDHFDSFTLQSGTTALVLQTGAFYLLDGNTWYAADGSGAPSDDSKVQSLSASPSLAFVPSDKIRFGNPIEVEEPIEIKGDPDEVPEPETDIPGVVEDAKR